MELKIFEQNKHLKSFTPFEIMATDITILNGIIKGEPIYQKGRKVKAGYYLDRAQTNLAIEKLFTDDIDENGFFIGLNIVMKWYDVYDNPVLTKEVYVPFSISESAEAITKRRKRAINYLQEAGVRLGVKPYIDILFNHYSRYQDNGVTKNLINSFIENGASELQDALLSEDNTDINGILNHELPNGVTVKESFLYQIT